MTGRVSIFRMFYNNVLVQSMRYFWPDISSMVVVLDQKKPDEHKYGDTIRTTFPFPRICYMANLTVPGYSGKDRMQRDMFYAEQCTSKRYVAFVDTDTMFITRIVLSCQPRVTVTSCFVYKVIRNLELIDHGCINPIRRLGLIHK